MAEPRCQYFRKCGGCKTQHIDYTIQVNNKVQAVLSELNRMGIDHPEPKIFSGDQYNYRSRMDFLMSPKGPALRKEGSFKNAVAIKSCDIADPKINTLLNELWDWWEKNKRKIDPFLLQRRSGTMKYVVIRASRNTDDSAVSFMLNEDAKDRQVQIDLIKQFAETTIAKNVVIALSPKDKDFSLSEDCFAVKGEESMTESLNNTTIRFHTQGFFQNNTAMTEKMLNHCKSIIQDKDTKEMTFVDLYGGSGTFGFTLKDNFKKTIIIDNEGVNIECAKNTIKEQEMKDIEAITADAGAIFAKLSEEQDIFLLTDPPRAGMHPKVIKRILGLNPKQIIYVSCNPKQMARELRQFQAKYKVTDLAFFDLFPQTNHVETILKLEKKR